MSLVRKIALGVAAVATAGGVGYMMQGQTAVGSMSMFRSSGPAPVSSALQPDNASQPEVAEAVDLAQPPVSLDAAVTAAPQGAQFVSASLPVSGSAPQDAPVSRDAQAPSPRPDLADNLSAGTAPGMGDVLNVSAPKSDDTSPDMPDPVRLALAEGDSLPAAGSAPIVNDAACVPTAKATAGAAAMVALEIAAPCLGDDRVTILHQGLVFTEVTDAEGRLNVTVPALAESAGFFISFSDETTVMAFAEVPSIDFYDRTVLQWKGGAGFGLHALEYGADYDSAGHVYAGADRDITIPARGEGGLITRLGNPEAPEPMLADVYTFPTATAKTNGTVAISIEAEVTTDNCGRSVDASVLSVLRGEMADSHDLEVTVPDCDATGEYLVLKNIVNDLKIARN
ncbi:hypothetical protein [Pseudooceanicola aestuarii]|uniref:hypothetical protein n=1 Tax=Pseudooceanicola aestuarii TaxID=2697319 RepID=UPI0013D8C8DE|nr:hypothetical protein [Pseudooceanicola aestuarii]